MPPPGQPIRPAQPGELAVVDRAQFARFLKEHGAIYEHLRVNTQMLEWLTRAARFDGKFIADPEAAHGFQTRIAPYSLGTPAIGANSGPGRVLLPRPSLIYGLQVGTFDSTTGLPNNQQSRFLLTRSNQDPLVVENLGSTSALVGVRPAELHGLDGIITNTNDGAFGRPWAMNRPLPSMGNDELVLRARNEAGSANPIRHFGALVYGEKSATVEPRLRRTVSKVGVMRFNNFTANAGPLTFPFRRPSMVYGLAGFGNAFATPLTTAAAIEISALFNNNDVIFTDFTVDQLIFGAGNTHGILLPHPYFTDSNSALEVTLRNQILAPAVATDYAVVIFYDEEAN